MKKWISVLVLLLFCLSSLMAQDKVELFGYFESQITGVEIKNDFYQLFTNKLRVDLKSSLSDKITFAANFDYITYHGKQDGTCWIFLQPI